MKEKETEAKEMNTAENRQQYGAMKQYKEDVGWEN